jgi:dipeptidyl aminopeptidase/acylaminoacyl peptidase
MAEVLRSHGIEYEFISNPNWGHAFDEDSGMQDPAVQEAFRQVMIFLKKHLK